MSFIKKFLKWLFCPFTDISVYPHCPDCSVYKGEWRSVGNAFEVPTEAIKPYNEATKTKALAKKSVKKATSSVTKKKKVGTTKKTTSVKQKRWA